MRKHALILPMTLPAVSAMVDWSSINLHLPPSLSSLLHPISALNDDRLHTTSNNAAISLPPAEAISTAVSSPIPDSDIAEATIASPPTHDSVVIVSIPSILNALLSSDSDPTAANEASALLESLGEAVEDGQATQIEDADVEFIVSPFLPPMPTIVRGDLNAPVSSHTSIPEAVLAEMAKADEDAGVWHGADMRMTTVEDRKESVSAVVSSIGLGKIAMIRHQAFEQLHQPRQLRPCLRHFLTSVSTHSQPLTNFLVPASSLQWIVFACSFTATLLLIIGRAVVLRSRRCRQLPRSVPAEWEKLSVAGVEVGVVQRRVLRRGDVVWVAASGGEEGLERVWLEDGVGVRGREIWGGAV